jgi:hypothetical protein
MGVLIRVLQPADVDAATAIFALGMRETIVAGIQDKLLAPKAALAGVALAALPVFVCWAGFTTEAAAALALALIALLIGVFVLLPKKIAHDYINKSLATDMKVSRQNRASCPCSVLCAIGRAAATPHSPSSHSACC